VHLAGDRQALIRITCRLHEVQQREPLAIRIAVDQNFMCGVRYYRRGNRTMRSADLLTQVWPDKILVDTFQSKEEECFVLNYRAANRAAVLFAMEILQFLSVGRVGSQSFESLIIEHAAMNIVCS